MKKFLLALIVVLAFSTSAWAAVDLNTATQSQLESLEGVGPKKAQAIIEFRKSNGAFKSVDDLDKVPGFGAKTVNSLRKDIVVGNAKAAVAGTPAKAVKATTPAKPIIKPVVTATKPAAMPAKAK